MTMLTGPLICAPAMAAPSSSGLHPNLDRPAAASVSHPSADPTGYPTGAAVDLDRPIAGYLPAAPAPAAKTTPHDRSNLVIGAAHRDTIDESYVVRRGDALWDIAARHLGPDATAVDIAREWPRWYAANRAVIGADPSLIRPGEVLHAPAG
jgi:resuscitation-promoting factor RpfA